MDRMLFEQMLHEMDPAAMAQHSRINHHVNGMDYLCLHRSDKLTVKLYLVENPTNPHSGFLVHPHSHRYAFSSMVLHGQLSHIRFTPLPPAGGYRVWQEHSYNPDSRALTHSGTASLMATNEFHQADDSYWVDPHEIHTLRLMDGAGPVLIGLMQFADVKAESSLYLPSGTFARSDERTATPAEAKRLQERCLELMGAN